jgi:signal transduction histidine kinase
VRRRRPALWAPARTGVERAHRFIALLLLLQRLSYLVPTALSVGSDAYADPGLNVVLVVVTIGWNVALFRQVRRHGWFSPALAWTDVAWAVLLTVVVSANSGAAYDHSSVNWSGRMAQASAALVGAAIQPYWAAAVALGLIMAAHALATTHAFAGSAALAGELASCLNGLFFFAVVIGFGVRYLRRQGTLLDRLAEERLATQASRVADRARYETRLDHFRALHDTVLGTLAAIALGGLDHRTPQVRERCARDADYVRRLMLSGAATDPGTLGEKLGRVVADAEALGLRVHFRLDDLPSAVSDEVSDALAGAVQEAMNNVVRHSGTRTVWLTVAGADDAIVVRVVDRGVGFAANDLVTAPVGGGRGGGFGLPYSVGERVRAVGGAARVVSAPGDGTCVELVWPA